MTDSIGGAPPQKQYFVRAQIFAIAIFMLLCFAGADASAAMAPWSSLSAEQHEALAPLSQQWDSLPEVQQQRLLKTAKRYPHLTNEQKQRFRNRLATWSKLTPEQRKAAREKYRAFKKVPAEKRKQVKELVKQNQENKAQQSASGVSATPSTNIP